MIVVDASAMLELLLATPKASAVAKRVFGISVPLHAPHLIDVEIAQVLRRAVLARNISAEQASLALDDFLAIPLYRTPHDILLPRIWQLRANLSAYDAAYVALAEALAAPLVTCDQRLAAAPGHKAAIELIA